MHYVRHTDDDGESMDMFVRALTAGDAVEAWVRHWIDGEEETLHGKVVVHVVPEGGAAGTGTHVIPWEEVPGAEFVVEDRDEGGCHVRPSGLSWGDVAGDGANLASGGEHDPTEA